MRDQTRKTNLNKNPETKKAVTKKERASVSHPIIEPLSQKDTSSCFFPFQPRPFEAADTALTCRAAKAASTATVRCPPFLPFPQTPAGDGSRLRRRTDPTARGLKGLVLFGGIRARRLCLGLRRTAFNRGTKTEAPGFLFSPRFCVLMSRFYCP